MAMRYDNMSIRVAKPFEQVVAAARDALKREGFGVLTEIDVKMTLKEKVGADVPKYVILGACNPSLAYTALQLDVNIGLLLPCNVIVREEDGASVVGIMDPLLMSQISDAAGLDEVARIAREKLDRVLAEIGS